MSKGNGVSEHAREITLQVDFRQGRLEGGTGIEYVLQEPLQVDGVQLQIRPARPAQRQYVLDQTVHAARDGHGKPKSSGGLHRKVISALFLQ